MEQVIHVDAAWRSLNKKQEELCGDRVQIRQNDKCTVMVLADGLGSGVKANILSTLTSTIISEMIFSGMSLKDAIDTIVATLPVDQEREVAYSTFTIIQVFYDGNAVIARFDNPTTVLIRNGKLWHPDTVVHDLNGKKVYVAHLQVQPEDYIVTFSDGVLYAGLGMTLNFGWGQEEVEDFLVSHLREKDTAAELSRILLTNVDSLYGGMPGDDSTVACVHVIEARETRVMVGPPSDPEDDRKVVSRLMSATGRKICCGGTTSLIVSRVTGHELTTDGLISFVSDVPPKGFIRGVDLVTEGVLTLQKVARFLKRAAGDPAFREQLMLSEETDGATCLAQELMGSSAVTFMVGLSDNPAHDAIAYSPLSLNAKIRLIEDLQNDLRQMGKIVKIEMY